MAVWLAVGVHVELCCRIPKSSGKDLGYCNSCDAVTKSPGVIVRR